MTRPLVEVRSIALVWGDGKRRRVERVIIGLACGHAIDRGARDRRRVRFRCPRCPQ